MGKAGVAEGAGCRPLAGTRDRLEGAGQELPAQSTSPPDPVHLPCPWSWPGSDRRRLRKAPSVWRVESVALIWSPPSYSKPMTVCPPRCARKEGASLLPPVLRGGSVARAGFLQAGPLAGTAHRCRWDSLPAIPLTPVPNHRSLT